MENVLKKIIEKKKEKLVIFKKQYTEKYLYSQINEIKNFQDFKKKLQKNYKKNTISIIAEIKKASPSTKIFNKNFNHIEIAKKYIENGAACLSVLTEEDFFLGNMNHIKDIKNIYTIPILCKDFFIDLYQVLLAKSFGADCILIILSALEIAKAREIYEFSKQQGLSTLIEVHTQKEAELALTFNDAIIGINNRNLKTLKVSLNTTVDLFKILKDHKSPLVCESGIKDKSDIDFIIKKTGIKNFLIGESLLKSNVIEDKLHELLK